MNKQEYIGQLKLALRGLPDEVAAKAVSDCELRFAEGRLSDQSEEYILKSLDDPAKIAAGLKASTKYLAFRKNKNSLNLWQLFISIVGLAVFNLFMVIPALVFSVLLFASYLIATAIFVAGSVVTASGLSGVHEVVIDHPFEHVVVSSSGAAGQANQARIEISHSGIHVSDLGTPSAQADSNTPAGAKAQVVAGSGRTMDAALTLQGIGLIVGGILLFLVSLVVSKYSLIGIKRYVLLNFSLLRARQETRACHAI